MSAARGDAALIELTERFDKVKLAACVLKTPKSMPPKAQCSREALKALDVAAGRIEAYHRRQLPKENPSSMKSRDARLALDRRSTRRCSA